MVGRTRKFPGRRATRIAACSFFLAVFGVGNPCFADEPILLEAESMQPGPGWKPVDHYTGSYERVPSGQKMLIGSSGPSDQARGHTTVPQAGDYRLWVRYLDLLRYRGPFHVFVRQGGREKARRVFDQESLRGDPAGLAKWGKGYACFVWASLDVTLQAGSVQIVVGKLPPIQTATAARTLDCFVLTSDKSHTPRVTDFVPPLYLRVILGRRHRKPCFVHIWGRRPRPPWYVEHHNLTQAGLSPGPHGGILGRQATDSDIQLTAGEATPWVNIAPLLDIQGMNRVHLTAIQRYNHPLERSDFTVEIAERPSAKHVLRSFRRKGQGAGIGVTIDLTRREDIRRDLEWSEEALGWARALSKPDGQRPRRFPILTGCTASPRTYSPKVVSAEVEILSRLGFSGLEAERTFFKAGFVHPRTGYIYFYLCDHGCFYQPQLEAIEKALRHKAEALKEEGFAKRLAYFGLMDEPGSMALEHIVRCPVCRKRFVEYIRSLDLAPSDVGKTTWSQVLPTVDREHEPRLYYHTVSFRSRALADYFALGTRIVGEVLPGVRTTSNFAESLTYSGNLLLRGVDWFEILGRQALTMGWTEDWLAQSATFQLCGYRADFLRSACRRANLPMGMYDILAGRSGWDVQAKGVTEIGHGARVLFEATYGPCYEMSGEAVSHRADLYPALQEMNHAVGKIEDDLLASHVPPAPIALHYSHATDVWTLDDSYSVFGKERMGIYLLLRHLGHPIDVVTEADVVEGQLADHRMLVLLGSHVRRDAVGPIAEWVAAGGHLYLGPGTGAFDEFHDPLDLMGTFGFRSAPLEVEQTCGRGQYEFPRLRVLDRVDAGTGSLEVVCAKGELSAVFYGATAPHPRRGPADVLARFDDGSPALVARSFGQGRVMASAFFVGLGYTRSGTVSRKRLWEQDAEAQKRTFNPPSFEAAYRTFFGGLVSAAGIEPRCTTSHHLVEASVLRIPKGFVIALANWSGTPQQDLDVAVQVERPLRKVVPAGLVVKDVRATEGVVHVVVDVDAAGFLVVRTR